MSETQIITAESEGLLPYFKKISRYRGLILKFAKRDLKIKYAQTYFGILWVLLQPIPSVVIFSFFFGKLIQVDTGILPYPIFALVGMTGWSYFINLASGVGNCLIESQHVLKKIYFPKFILPLSKILVGAIDLAISFFVIIAARSEEHTSELQSRGLIS